MSYFKYLKYYLISNLYFDTNYICVDLFLFVFVKFRPAGIVNDLLKNSKC